MGIRRSAISRETAETKITLALDVDGSGKASVSTGIGFFDHMLTLFAKHSLFDIEVKATGDLHVDSHHTVEDVGICMGKALAEALGDKRGIVRYGSFLLPMDEELARIVLDLSGRSCLVWNFPIPVSRTGEFDTCLGREFMRALCQNAGINMHADLLASAGEPHHSLEALFKGTGRALRQAVSVDPREGGIPSSKGIL